MVTNESDRMTQIRKAAAVRPLVFIGVVTVVLTVLFVALLVLAFG